MNSCVLMAEIVQDPQLRHVNNDNMMAIAEMLVEFPGARTEDPPARLKVVGWGNLAQEIQQTYHKGDRVIIEGRLGMNTVQLDGYKEKRAELTVQKIHPLGEGVSIVSSTKGTVETNSYATDEDAGHSRPEPSPRQPVAVAVATKSEPAPITPKPPLPTPEADVDEIPF